MPVLEMPKYGQHLIFLGSTGSGKSFLAKQMLLQYQKYFAIDTQDSLDLPGKRIRSPDMLSLKLSLFKRLIYTPELKYKYREYWNQVLKDILNSSSKKEPKERVIYIDEVYHMGYGHAAFPDYLPRGITTARQQKISFWIAAQRPKNIPGEVLTEASRILIFRLSKYDDIKFISGFSRQNPKDLQRVLSMQEDDHSFIEINNRTGTFQKFGPLNIKL